MDYRKPKYVCIKLSQTTICLIGFTILLGKIGQINGDDNLGCLKGRNFFLSETSMSSAAGKQYCLDRGMKLATLNARGLFNEIHQRINSKYGAIKYQIGLQLDVVDLQWKWQTGEMMAWARWWTSDPGNVQPNGRVNINELYTFVWNNGYWHDVDPPWSSQALCEKYITIADQPHAATVQASTVKNTRLIGHKLHSKTTRSKLECIKLCTKIINCKSVNYMKESKLCELNNLTLALAPNVYESGSCYVQIEGNFLC